MVGPEHRDYLASYTVRKADRFQGIDAAGQWLEVAIFTYMFSMPDKAMQVHVKLTLKLT